MNKINIKEIAKNVTTLSELMNGREKIETDDIIKYHSEYITIYAAERLELPDEKTKELKPCYIYLFEEESDKFAFGGYMLTKIFDAILSECDGDIKAFNDLLDVQKLRVQLKNGKTKDKKPITLVEVL